MTATTMDRHVSIGISLATGFATENQMTGMKRRYPRLPGQGGKSQISAISCNIKEAMVRLPRVYKTAALPLC